MDGSDISPRIAALVACIEADASQRVIVHNRRMCAHQHVQPAASAPILKQQQPAIGAGLPPKHQHGGFHNNCRIPAQQAPGEHAILEPAAAPPIAQATAEADADADADADVPAADLSSSLEHGCKLPRFAASSANQSDQDDTAQMQSGHLRRSDRLRQAAVREADAAQRAGRFNQSSIAERHMSCQHASQTQQRQAKIDRGFVKIRAVKRAR